MEGRKWTGTTIIEKPSYANFTNARRDFVLDLALAYKADGGVITASAFRRRLGEYGKKYDAVRERFFNN